MLIDLHTHTYPYSDDSHLPPEELVERAKRAGLDAICLTEHDWHWKEEDIARLRREQSFPIFRGMEISSDEGHILVFGLSEYRFGMHHASYVRELLEEVCKNPVLGLVDAVETLNGRSRDKENRFAIEVSRRMGLRGVGGSDAHSHEDVPSCATVFERQITCLEELIAELRAGRFGAVDLR
jgi:predicted metal-dependent phosphoesterase TrpH